MPSHAVRSLCRVYPVHGHASILGSEDPGRTQPPSYELAQRSGLSLPTIQRMEASEGVIRGNVDSLMKLMDALAAAGIELIGEGAVSHAGGRGVRLRR